MATGDENSIATTRTMGKKSSRMESRPQHYNQDIQSSRKTNKRWEHEINDVLKPVKTEATKGSDLKNNDTWILVAKQRTNGKKRKTN